MNPEHPDRSAERVLRAHETLRHEREREAHTDRKTRTHRPDDVDRGLVDDPAVDKLHRMDRNGTEEAGDGATCPHRQPYILDIG